MTKLARKQRREAWEKARMVIRQPLGDKTNSLHPACPPVPPATSGFRETRTAAEKINKLTVDLNSREQELANLQEFSQNQVDLNKTLQETVATLRTSVNMLQDNLSITKASLTRTAGSLQKARKRAYQSSASLYNTRRALQRQQQGIITSLRGKIEMLMAEVKQQRNQLTDKTNEVFHQHCRAESYLRELAAAHTRALQYWNHLQQAENQQLMLLNKISTLSHRLSQLQTSFTDLQKLNRRCRVRLSRAEQRKWDLESVRSALRMFLQLVEKGTYSSPIRSLVLRLVQQGCPVANVGRTIDAFVQIVLHVTGHWRPRKKKRKISPRTVSRIIQEGDVAGKIQLGYELHRTQSLTSGGDGTTNKNQTFEAISFNLQAKKTYLEEDGTPSSSLDDEQKVRFVKVEIAANHRAETQKNETIAAMREAIKIFNKSPLAFADNTPGQPFDESMVAMKYVGTHGDHAEDQKAKHRLLGKWKQELTMRGLGAQYLSSKTSEEQEALISSAKAAMVEEQGGEMVWQTKDYREKIESEEKAIHSLCESLAGEAYERLSDNDKRHLKLWVWAGCGMHKDLNSVKGGDSAMQAKWKEVGIAPVPLANKDNTAVLELADEQAWEADDDEEKQEEGLVEKRAREVTKAGAVKLVNLIGALLNHKDDKKGQQHSFRDFMIFNAGRTFTFPDTSNTRYSSYLEAAAEVVAHLDKYIEYMHFIRDSKEKRVLNNLEANVLKGLQDVPTLTELSVLALYQEAISFSYISSIRGPGLQQLNALELAPLHLKVRTHIKKLINNPEIILSSSADPRQATMNAFDSWKNADAVRAVHDLCLRLPHVTELFKAFLEGALVTWERFSSEFADDGTIAALTEAEHVLAWIPATNDANEGALGAYRVFAQKNPSGTLRLFNSIFRMRRNDTQNFMDAMLTGPEHESFLRREARSQDSLGLERKRRRGIYEEVLESVSKKRRKDIVRSEKRAERTSQLEAIEIEDNRDIVDKMTCSQLKDQLDKLRLVDKQIPLESKMKKKDKKVAELHKALDRLNKQDGEDKN